MADEKRCRKCGEIKPLTDFRASRPKCRACEREEARDWYRTNRDLAIPRQRDRRILRLYGISAEEYAARLLEQHGVCAVCHQPETSIRKGVVMQLSVDHDHADGHVRGLLCNNCNRMLGLAEDSQERLKQLLYYLEQS